MRDGDFLLVLTRCNFNYNILMNILLNKSLDTLYKKYTLTYIDDGESTNIEVKPRERNASHTHIFWVIYPELNFLEITSLEWPWVWHELMILMLIEAYYNKVEVIRLNAGPVLTSQNYSISTSELIRFYRNFWFRTDKNLVIKGRNLTPMKFHSWKKLSEQVQKYVQKHSTPRT